MCTATCVAIYMLQFLIPVCWLILSECIQSAWTVPNICPEYKVCNCTRNVDMVDINCYNITDIDQIQPLLQVRFTNITINKLFIKNCLVRFIPDRAFENLTIQKIFFPCPIEEMAPGAFGGLNGNIYLKFASTKFMNIPQAVSNATKLMQLAIEDGNLQSVDLELENLTELLYLSLKNNTIVILSSNALINLTKIVRLDLSMNRLAFIDPNALDSMRSLNFLFLRFNYLHSVDDLLKNLNPAVVDLHGNKLTSVKRLFHSQMWAVSEIYLGQNFLQSISSETFSGRVPNLKILELRDAHLRDLNANLFQSLSLLATLDLSYNKMKSLPLSTFQHLVGLHTLKLNDNNIVSLQGLFQSVPELNFLSLSHNRIEVLGDSLQQMRKLEQLYLDNNKISFIKSENFLYLINLQTLNIGYNSIHYIEENSFFILRSLQMLVLTGNEITTLNHSIHSLSSLDKLYLHNNRIRVIDDTEFFGLLNLRSFFMNGNGVESLNGAFASLASLDILELRKNNLSTLSSDSLANPIHLDLLDLSSGNAWSCDCRILWLLDWLIKTNFTALNGKPICHSPERLQGKTFQQLVLEDLTNWPEDCPDSCSCTCEPKDRYFFVSTNCSAKNLSSIPVSFPPHMGTLDMSGNLLKIVTDLVNVTTDYLWYLNMEDNWISLLDTRFPSSLKVLLLAGNNLTRFDHTIVSNVSMQSMTLSRNPWKCDCLTVSFRRWLLSQNKVVSDLNDTRCGPSQENKDLSNKVIVFLTDTQLCPPKLALYISISVGVLVILLVFTSLMLAYSRNQLSIKVRMYSHGFTWVKEEDLDTDKTFDVFISYSSYDEEFVVLQFISDLKWRVPEISVCTQDFFPPGEFIQTNILNAVQASKRTVLVLSENFLRSSWCMMEFRAAYTQALEDKIHRLLVVRYGDISPSCEIDPTLQKYLDSTTYLKWGEKHFWAKLIYALPKKKSRKPNSNSKAPINCEKTPLLSHSEHT